LSKSHIALALLHFSDFDLNTKLFRIFWFISDTKKKEEFVSFIGRYTASRQNAAEFIKENNIDPKKIMEIWDWVLKKCNIESVFAEFGFWIQTESTIFTPEWLAEYTQKTLEKSDGTLKWEYGMMKSLPILSVNAPEITLDFLGKYLFKLGSSDGHILSIYVDSEIFNALKTLYENPVTKIKTRTLIAKLLPLGAGQFWPLEEILK
jgi:hypothetical protein